MNKIKATYMWKKNLLDVIKTFLSKLPKLPYQWDLVFGMKCLIFILCVCELSTAIVMTNNVNSFSLNGLYEYG